MLFCRFLHLLNVFLKKILLFANSALSFFLLIPEAKHKLPKSDLLLHGPNRTGRSQKRLCNRVLFPGLGLGATIRTRNHVFRLGRVFLSWKFGTIRTFGNVLINFETILLTNPTGIECPISVLALCLCPFFRFRPFSGIVGFKSTLFIFPD